VSTGTLGGDCFVFARDVAGFVVVAICVRIAGAILLVRIARGREYPFDLATGGLISW